MAALGLRPRQTPHFRRERPDPDARGWPRPVRRRERHHHGSTTTSRRAGARGTRPSSPTEAADRRASW